MMGLEEHLLHMFRDDFEFGSEAAPSHLGAPRRQEVMATAETSDLSIAAPAGPAAWSPDAETELRKIPFFVRGKARRNTEKFATERGLAVIELDTLYEAKAHFGR
jgi:light-independent protochlorophyllide reductase subunit B